MSGDGQMIPQEKTFGPSHLLYVVAEKMSTPIVQQYSPPTEVTQQAYTTHSGHGSVGPVIAVLAVITVLGVIAGMIGRLCSGRRVMGHGEYDFETWVETKCSSCVDGRIAPPPPPPPPAEPNAAEDPPPVEPPQEIKEEEQQQQPRQNSHAHRDS
ncbi:hypothetical protein VNO77_04794 [Canavalia gladiata]|uniref:Uncharacterized protein n=1 Tax=Canavalia gladiata TaxID=3824 RepID=A0AAN9R9E3_CANGL